MYCIYVTSTKENILITKKISKKLIMYVHIHTLINSLEYSNHLLMIQTEINHDHVCIMDTKCSDNSHANSIRPDIFTLNASIL